MAIFGKKKKRGSALADTPTVTSRMSEAKQVEEKKLALKREIEKLMKDFAKESGEKSYSARKYSVGKSPNDWTEKIK